jgi:hypothetical protein
MRGITKNGFPAPTNFVIIFKKVIAKQEDHTRVDTPGVS